MCGILAYFGETILETNHPALTSIAHRGPDGYGMQCYKVRDHFLSLGHRRLSIIDLTKKALQPMRYQETELWITYNGEIYNYLELRAELQQAGFQFSTDSDTEVLLASYQRWGKNCLERLNGMFAFSIWDSQSKKLFVARDRYGIKPLFYWNSPVGFAVVSEIKQMTSLPGFSAALNMDTAYQFLLFGDFCYDENTLWKNVLELEPGMMFQLDLNKWRPGDFISLQKWYDFTPHLDSRPINESRAIEKFHYLLEDSIKLRLRSDVPVGFGLSGGLDSSAITCIAAKNIKPVFPLHTFSACYEDSSIDERPYIDAVLSDINAEVHKAFIDPSYIIDNMDIVTKNHDLPTSRMTIFPHHLLCQLSHSIGTKVVLEGQGADETLAGYTEFLWSYLVDLLFNFKWINAIKEYSHIKRNGGTSMLYGLQQILYTIFPDLLGVLNRQNAFMDKKESFLKFHDLNGSRLNQCHIINRKQKSIREMHRIRMILLRSILHNVDRVSMAHSVEIRSPFLDYRLIEFSLCLPASLKILNGTHKYILRKAAQNILPAKVLERKDKMGFPSPESQWAKGPLEYFYREGLRDLNDIPFINSKVALDDFERFTKGLIPYNRIFWRLIGFQRWMKIFKISI